MNGSTFVHTHTFVYAHTYIPIHICSLKIKTDKQINFLSTIVMEKGHVKLRICYNSLYT